VLKTAIMRGHRSRHSGIWSFDRGSQKRRRKEEKQQRGVQAQYRLLLKFAKSLGKSPGDHYSNALLLQFQLEKRGFRQLKTRASKFREDKRSKEKRT